MQSDKKKLLKELAPAIAQKAYEIVGQRMVQESMKNAERINKGLEAHIKAFDSKLVERVREIVKEELNSK